MLGALTTRVDQDLELRASKGSFTYVLAWLVIAIGLGFYEVSPTSFWLWTAALTLVGLSRTLLAHLSNRMRPQFRDVWWALFVINGVAPALCYGILLALSLTNPTYAIMFEYLLMAVFAFVSGGAINFAPNKKLLLAFHSGLIIPPTIAALFWSETQQMVGVLLIIYGAFMFVPKV